MGYTYCLKHMSKKTFVVYFHLRSFFHLVMIQLGFKFAKSSSNLPNGFESLHSRWQS